MKKSLQILVIINICIILFPFAAATDAGAGIGINFRTEDFKPLMWLCDSRSVSEDNIEYGRVSGPEEPLGERTQNYAFEGEQVSWAILVMDKNKIEDVKDVFVSIGPFNDARRLVPYTYYDTGCLEDCEDDLDMCVGDCDVPIYDPEYDPECVDGCESDKVSCDQSCKRTGMRLEQNDIEVECKRATTGGGEIPSSCNARIQEEKLTNFDPQTMAYYQCVFTVETPLSMHGEHWVTIEAEDHSGLYNHIDEGEYWVFNPTIAVSVEGDLDFGIVRPGTIAYSDSILVGNDADEGSGVLLDMFISGTDFYDPASAGSRCVITNRLKLGDNYAASGDSRGNNNCNIGFGDTDDHLCYYASKGAYGTQSDPRKDSEGYVGIVYGDAFTTNFYNDAEITQGGLMAGPYYLGNILSPGSEVALTFKLGLPEPCVGDFTDGDIFFWGEAI